MTVQNNAYLKTRFEYADIPTAQDFVDLIDTITDGVSSSTISNTTDFEGATLNEVLSTISQSSNKVLEANITIHSFTIPSLSAGNTVVQKNLGSLTNPCQALMSFYVSGGTFANAISGIQLGNLGDSASTPIKLGRGDTAVHSLRVPFPNSSLDDGPDGSHAIPNRASFLLVFDDPLQTRRFARPIQTEYFGPSSSAAPVDTYSPPPIIEYLGAFSHNAFKQLVNVPYLVGWVSPDLGNPSGATRYGALDIDGFVELETAWITQSGPDCIANFSFYNESSATDSKNIAIVLYQ